jgi:nucleoside-diphosphate-sugar epimerase
LTRTALGAGPLLVTGAGGWIGSLLVSRLLEASAGTEIHRPSRGELDLADAQMVEAFLAETRPRKVVHLAASMARDEGSSSIAEQWRDTFLAGRTVVQAAATAGVHQLIMAGTMEELGDQAGILETSLPSQPRTTYGLCKTLVREVACFEARRAPMRIDWIRPTTAYGPGQRGTMVVPSACVAARSGRPTAFTIGIQKRDFLFVEDLLDWILLALDDRVGEQGELGFHLHNLGTGVGVTVREVLDLIASELPAARFELGAIPRREHEPLVQIAPPYRSEDPVLSSWKAKTTWEVGIKKTTDWWSAQAAESMP